MYKNNANVLSKYCQYIFEYNLLLSNYCLCIPALFAFS